MPQAQVIRKRKTKIASGKSYRLTYNTVKMSQ